MGWFSKKSDGNRSSADPVATAAVGAYMLAKDSAVATTSTTSKKQYVAPTPVLISPASPSNSSVPQKSPESQNVSDTEEEEMVVIDKPHIEPCLTEDGYGDLENPVSTSYSRAVESEQDRRNHGADVPTNSKQNHLNSLFNGHLMKWKFDAEEGTAFLRVPACKCRIRFHLF
jgi:hypothetical protein